MRTAADFDSFYEKPDPWRISRFHVRNNALRRRLSKLVRGRTILELGSGEGHLTKTVFGSAQFVQGVDLSQTAVDRAHALNLPNATFEVGDYMKRSFEGFDLIAAIECVNYLSEEERTAFFRKVAKEHAGKLFVFSGPIIGGKYFTHDWIAHIFTRFDFELVGAYNVTAYWEPFPLRIAANLIKLPLGYRALDFLPESMIYQRLYIARAPNSFLPIGKHS